MEAMSSEKKSEIRSVIEELSMLADLRASDDHIEPKIPFKPFVSVCHLLLRVLDKIGPTMAVLRQDIHQNIQRLKMVHDEADSSTYFNLVEILKKEAAQGNAKKVDSCSRALLWITRSLDFTVELLQKYSTSCLDENMNQIVEDTYTITLKPWHGWISSTAVKVALKLVPSHKTFLNALMEKEDHDNPDSLKDDLQTFVSLLKPLLEEIHSSLRAHGVDRLKST